MVREWKLGADDCPAWTLKSFMSQRCRVWPWRGLPPLARKSRLVTFTVNFEPAQIGSGPGEVVFGFSSMLPGFIWCAGPGLGGQATFDLSAFCGMNCAALNMFTSCSVVAL